MRDIFYFTLQGNVRDQWRRDGNSTVELDCRPQFFELFTDALDSAEAQFAEESPDVVIVYVGDWDCGAIAVSAVSIASAGKARPAASHYVPVLSTERDAHFVLVRELTTTIYSGV